MKFYFKNIFKYSKDNVKEEKTFYNWLIVFIGILWILFHLITIERSPIPNFDEAFFANMTKSLQKDGTLMLRMSTMTKFENEEVWLYGPIYFYAQAYITNFIGWGIWQFRLLNLIAGFGIVFLIMAIARSLLMKRIPMLVLFCMLIMDSEINFNMHSGRMDSLAMLFFLAGFYLFFFTQQKKISYIICASIFFSAALLTTPRVGFLFLILPVGFLFDLYYNILGQKNSISKPLQFWSIFIKYSISFIIISVPFFMWIIFRVKGIDRYLNEFSNNDVLKSLISYFNIPKFNLLPAVCFYLLVIGLIAFLYFKRHNPNSHKFNNAVYDRRIILIFLLPLIYLFFIKGGYYVYMMPVLYLGISYMVLQKRLLHEHSIRYFKGVFTVYFISLLVINTIIFSIKLTYLIDSWQARDPHFFKSYFETKQFKNENLLASHPYHFVISEENRYISNDDNRDLNAVKADRLMVKHAFLTIRSYEKDKNYFKELGFKEVERFTLSENRKSILSELLIKFPLDILQSYDGIYLQRELGSMTKVSLTHY